VNIVQNTEQLNESNENEVGIRLQIVREKHKLSQRQLARMSGVGNGTISSIESGSSNPSVGALKRILNGIPMDLATFFSFELKRDSNAYFRSDELLEIGSGGVSYRLVGASLSGREIQMLHEIYAPGADSGRVKLSHEGEECAVVIRGRLEVSVGEEKRLLRAGDAYYFSSKIPHRFYNPDDSEECELVSACTPANF
jgi:transcriptional regulator with XRE-family HTH domain